VGHNGTNEREIYQGGDKTGEPSSDSAIGIDFDVSSFVYIFRQPKTLRLWKRMAMFGIDLDIDAVELLDDVPDGKWCQVSQAAVPLLWVFNIKADLLKKTPVW
jgi:hypothetical protein